MLFCLMAEKTFPFLRTPRWNKPVAKGGVLLHYPYHNENLFTMKCLTTKVSTMLNIIKIIKPIYND